MAPEEESMKILVVCGAGASSTFVAQRINSAARTRKLAYIATATDEASLAERVGSTELILLGPHLAPHLEEITGLAAPYGVTVILLDADVFADFDGLRTMARIEAAVLDGEHLNPSSTTN
jgi:cellobiose PTS system EIIB component